MQQTYFMTTFQEIIDTYQTIISESEIKLNKAKRGIYRIGTLRLLLFVAGIAGLIYFRNAGWLTEVSCAALTFIPFFFSVKWHKRLFDKKDYLEKKVEINQQELQAVVDEKSSFDDGSEFADDEHLYSLDLDIFGDHSLFQLLNRTVTTPGKKRLALWLKEHLTNEEAILKRQEAVKELTAKLKLRQRFRIQGLLYKGKITDEKEINEWATMKSIFRPHFIYRILPGVVLVINLIGISLAAINLISWIAYITFLFTIGILSVIFSKTISNIQANYDNKLKVLGTYTVLIQLIEQETVESKELKELKELTESNKQHTASQAVGQLSALMTKLDQRNNIFLTFFRNGFYFWELLQVMHIEKWKEIHAAELPSWMEAIARMDALCSLATFAYNHPEFVYPTISSDSFLLYAKAMGNPLMKRNKCVRNDINITKQPYFVIITGANMAGKSTYLRTIGVNYLLACMGLPVDAEQMTVYPAQLITSLRTTDSLNNNESYFFAELKRLKLIIDKLKSNEELFIILDEILKGTNSVDKQKGSLALIKQLLQLNTNGIIATHDLRLSSLQDQYPDNISNYCFEADIKDNDLAFSYKMQKGVAQNMNACFLMKKMGIAVIE